jgi:hypothetical protein
MYRLTCSLRDIKYFSLMRQTLTAAQRYEREKTSMTVPDQNNQAQQQTQPSSKELNFRALEQKYQRELQQEREARAEAQRLLAIQSRKREVEEDDEDDAPIDKRRLSKHLQEFGEQTKQTTQADIKNAVQEALGQERKNNWLNQNSDFHDVLQHADKFIEQHKDLAEAILDMPEGFERQKLVYKNIKALGLHKPQDPKSTVQDKINQNRRSPFYQPSEMGAAPYAPQGDFSKEGQKQAYDKLQQLKKNMRLG